MPGNDITRPQASPPARTTDVFDAMRSEMNRLFDSFDRGWPMLPTLLRRGGDLEMPSLDLDVRDDGRAYVIEADLPGVEEKDVTVTLTNGVLTIRGTRNTQREEKKDDYVLAERSYGSFQRALRLPDIVDEARIEAHVDKGVLRITAPKKADAMAAERKIEVRKKA